MAPITLSDDLAISSLELDSRSSTASSLDEHIDVAQYLESLTLAEREALNIAPSLSTTINNLIKRSDSNPEIATHVLLARDSTSTSNPLSGGIAPSEFNNKGVQAVFALIGASFVLGAIWFFFWAKNGGFRWRRDDWDDYKSTVLRRKGPDGKTLSNATKSTKLGGGSIVGSRYRDFAHEDDAVTLGMSEITKAVSQDSRLTGGSRVMGAGKRIKRMRERMAEKKAKKSAAANVRKPNNKSYNEKYPKQHHRDSREEDHHNKDDTLRAYQKERPARVGGLNKDSDGQGTVFYGSTEYSHSDTSSTYNPAPPPLYHHHNRSNNNNHHQSSSSSPYRHSGSGNGTPQRRSSPEKRSSHIRQVSTASQDYHHRSSPRQHSRQSSPTKPSPASAGPRRSMPGSFADPLDFQSDDTSSQGTRSYHHPIPGLSGNANASGGFRRGRRDSLGS